MITRAKGALYLSSLLPQYYQTDRSWQQTFVVNSAPASLNSKPSKKKSGGHSKDIEVLQDPFLFHPRKNGYLISVSADGGLEVHSVPLLRQPQPQHF
ncbi:hypothetical protein EVAR_8635_1 [Eumeta japonica]|uniref:Uncharacterized protein n=1 Tax=Eumeta variegata TaxID=151549 RepID=A0A4C1TUF5_EUMVA|nr:hypothetical protein EVAR_8635_1 [Eumeta japonica]